jgi:hypothetical protein
MIREKSHHTDSWFLESNGEKVQWDLSLISQESAQIPVFWNPMVKRCYWIFL